MLRCKDYSSSNYGNLASLTMGDMYTIQKYLETKSVTLMIDRDKLTCICID